jgi:hypothetical protein
MEPPYITITDDFDGVTGSTRERGIGSIIVGHRMLDVCLVKEADEPEPVLLLTIQDAIPGDTPTRRVISVPRDTVGELIKILCLAKMRIYQWPET